MGEVVSWPKINFLPTEPDVLRGSQLWESMEEEDSKAELKVTRARSAVEVAPLLKTKSKPSVVHRLKKGQTSEWEFPDIEDDIDAPKEIIGRGSRGRGKGVRRGDNIGRVGSRRGRGGKGYVDKNLGVNCAQESQDGVEGKSRGGGKRGRGRSTRGQRINSARGRGGKGDIRKHNCDQEAEDWKTRTVAERRSEQMNDVLIRVTSREANLGKERRGKESLEGLKVLKKQDNVKRTGTGVENWVTDSYNDFNFRKLDRTLMSGIRVGISNCFVYSEIVV